MEILQIRAFSKRLCEKKKKKKGKKAWLYFIFTRFVTHFFLKVIFQVHILSLSKLSLYFFFHPSKEGKILIFRALLRKWILPYLEVDKVYKFSDCERFFWLKYSFYVCHTKVLFLANQKRALSRFFSTFFLQLKLLVTHFSDQELCCRLYNHFCSFITDSFYQRNLTFTKQAILIHPVWCSGDF